MSWRPEVTCFHSDFSEKTPVKNGLKNSYRIKIVIMINLIQIESKVDCSAILSHVQFHVTLYNNTILILLEQQQNKHLEYSERFEEKTGVVGNQRKN